MNNSYNAYVNNKIDSMNLAQAQSMLINKAIYHFKKLEPCSKENRTEDFLKACGNVMEILEYLIIIIEHSMEGQEEKPLFVALYRKLIFKFTKMSLDYNPELAQEIRTELERIYELWQKWDNVAKTFHNPVN